MRIAALVLGLIGALFGLIGGAGVLFVGGMFGSMAQEIDPEAAAEMGPLGGAMAGIGAIGLVGGLLGLVGALVVLGAPRWAGVLMAVAAVLTLIGGFNLFAAILLGVGAGLAFFMPATASSTT